MLPPQQKASALLLEVLLVVPANVLLALSDAGQGLVAELAPHRVLLHLGPANSNSISAARLAGGRGYLSAGLPVFRSQAKRKNNL